MTRNDRLVDLVTDWLESQPDKASDRLLDTVLTDLRTAPQRDRWRIALRRFPMFGSNSLRLATAVGAVALVALIGLAMLGGRTPPTGPGAVPTPGSSPTSTPRVLTGDDEEATQAGTYVTGDPFPMGVTFTLPDGWQASIGGPYAVFLGRPGDTVEVAFTIFDRVYADPCDYDEGLLDPPGSSVDDLATALASLPSVDATAPTPATLGGYQGQQLTLTAPDSFAGCNLAEGEFFRVWELPLGATLDMQPGQVNKVWILDVEGQRLIIDTAETPASTAQGKADAQAIIDSISIEHGK